MNNNIQLNCPLFQV